MKNFKSHGRWLDGDIKDLVKVYRKTLPQQSASQFWEAVSNSHPGRSSGSIRNRLESLGYKAKKMPQMCSCGERIIAKGRRVCDICSGDDTPLEVLKGGPIQRLFDEFGGMTAAARRFDTTAQRLSACRRRGRIPADLMYKMLDCAIIHSPGDWEESDARRLLGVPMGDAGD